MGHWCPQSATGIKKNVLTPSQGLKTSLPCLKVIMSGASHSSVSTAAGFSSWVSKNMITKAL